MSDRGEMRKTVAPKRWKFGNVGDSGITRISAGPNLHSSPTAFNNDQVKKHRMGMTRNTNGKYQQYV